MTRAERKEWSDCAYAALRNYIRSPANKRFTTEQFRSDWEGFPEPDDPRDWGIPIRRAVRDGLIQASGYVPSGKVSHGRPVTVWVVNAD